MKRMTGHVQWQQYITYAQGIKDEFKGVSDGQWFPLKFYQKIKYTQANNDLVELKWYNVYDDYCVELRQANGTLVFDPRQSTFNNYQTQQGQLLLEIVTKEIHIDNNGSQCHIRINYQTKIHQEIIADYEFQLIFTH